MTEENTITVDTEKIMDEIRERVREHGEYESILSFDEIPMPAAETAASPAPVGGEGPLKDRVLRRIGSWLVPWVYPITEKRLPFRIYKRLMSKIARCVLFPLAQRVTETNGNLRAGIEETAAEVDRQQEQIRLLEARLEKLERK